MTEQELVDRFKLIGEQLLSHMKKYESSRPWAFDAIDSVWNRAFELTDEISHG